MKKYSNSRSAFFNCRFLLGFVLFSAGFVLALMSLTAHSPLSAQSPTGEANGNKFGSSYRNDVSPPLRELPPWSEVDRKEEHEANENPKIPHRHKDEADPVIQNRHSANSSTLNAVAPNLAAALSNFDGIPFPGVGCNCAPPDTNGAVGKTQYAQMVNEGYQVFDKTTGNSILGPNSIESLWSGFAGLCQTSGFGDPVVVFDQIARRWVITEIAGSSIPTEFCVAVSTTDDATGSYNRYDFHLNNNFNDYPKISVWPDAYYVSINLFSGTTFAYLGPHA